MFSPSISTFEPTKKEANVPNINTIPGTDVFYFDCRFLPSYSVDEVKSEVDGIIEKAEKDFKVKVSCEVVHQASSKATSPDCELVKKYSKAVREVYKAQPRTIGIGGGTLAAVARNHGFAAVVASKMYENPHIPNEKSSLKFITENAKAICFTLLNYETA
jgi:succinyl-diaminopimelate desuccinylase